MKKLVLTESQYLALLTEAKDPHEIYNEYYSDIEYDDFYKIVKSDPRTKEKKGKLKKIGKYAKILLDIYRDGNLRFEDLDKAHDYLEIAYNHSIPLPKEQINEISDIYHFVKHKIAEETYDLDTIFDLLDDKDYAVIYNDSKWLVATPETEKGACKLGAGTEWCTAFGEHSLDKEKQERWNAYQEYEGGLSIFINKNDPQEKYQLYIDYDSLEDENNIEPDNIRIEAMDENDDIVDTEFLIGMVEEPMDLIKELFEPIKNSHNVRIGLLIPYARVAMHISPDTLNNEIINEIVKNEENELLKTVIKGTVDEAILDLEEEISKNYIDDNTAVEDVEITEHLDVGPESITFELNKEDVYDENFKGIKKFLLNIEILNSARNDIPIISHNLLKNDPLLTEEKFDEVIKNAINEYVEDKSLDKGEIYRQIRKKDESLLKAFKKDIQRYTSHFITELKERRGANIVRATIGMDDIEVEFKYGLFLDYLMENNIQTITTEVIADAFFDMHNDSNLFNSYEEILERRDKVYEGDPHFTFTMKELKREIEEITKDMKRTEETRKINRLMFYD